MDLILASGIVAAVGFAAWAVTYPVQLLEFILFKHINGPDEMAFSVIVWVFLVLILFTATLLTCT